MCVCSWNFTYNFTISITDSMNTTFQWIKFYYLQFKLWRFFFSLFDCGDAEFCTERLKWNGCLNGLLSLPNERIKNIPCFLVFVCHWLSWNPGILGFFYWLYVKVIEKSKVKWNAMQWSSVCISITVKQHLKSGYLVGICICAMCSGTQCEWHFNWTSSWIRVRMVITEFSCRVEIRSTRHRYLRSMLSLSLSLSFLLFFTLSLSYSFFSSFLFISLRFFRTSINIHLECVACAMCVH